MITRLLVKTKKLIQFYVKLPTAYLCCPAIRLVRYTAKSTDCNPGCMYVTGDYKMKRFGGLIYQDKGCQRMVIIKRNFWNNAIDCVPR